MFLDVFSKEQYGLWVTIFSMLTWISMFDFGLSQGLRNKLTEYFSTKNLSDAKESIDITYQITFFISLIILLLTILISFFVGFQTIFNVNSNNIDVNNLIILVVSIYSIQFIFNNINGIFHALQNSKAIVFTQFLSSISTLIFLYLCLYNDINSMKIIAFGILFGNVIISLFASLYAFKIIKNTYGFSLSFNPFKTINSRIKNSLIKLSYKFFILQFSAIFLLNAINYLITFLYGSEKVVPFSIASKVYLNLLFIFYIIITPFWSAFTESYFKKDYPWLVRSFKKTILIYLAFVIISTLCFFLMDDIVLFWVGDSVSIPKDINLALYIYSLIMGWNGIFTYFLNGLNLINSQFKISIIHILTNIPLCIFLARYFEMGVPGLIWGTCISLLIISVIIPIQVFKVIKPLYNVQ
jgi:O-antigen/teichoic acid export membrane protein